jgi:hypothetical protein
MISCQNSESAGENSFPESETTVISHALRLSEDLMHHMKERFGDFYSKLERILVNNTQLAQLQCCLFNETLVSLSFVSESQIRCVSARLISSDIHHNNGVNTLLANQLILTSYLHFT